MGAQVKDRYGRCAFISHCLLNPNSRASYIHKLRGVNWEILSILQAHRVDPIQLPCPEWEYYGYPRNPKTKQFYDNEGYRDYCRLKASRLCDYINKMSKKDKDIEFVAVIGLDPSPSCAVREVASGKDENNNTIFKAKRGVFMEEIETQFLKNSLNIPMVSWTSYDPDIDKRVEELNKCLKRY